MDVRARRRRWRGGATAFSSFLIAAALVAFSARSPIGAREIAAGSSSLASTNQWVTLLQLDLPGSIAPSCKVGVAPKDVLGSAAIAECSPRLPALRSLTYRIFRSVAAMNWAYEIVAVEGAGSYLPNSGCSVTWKLGDCSYHHKGWPSGRVFREMEGDVPVMEVTFPGAPILLSLIGKAKGEAALERYFSSFAAAPDDFRPIVPRPSPAQVLLGLVPASLRSSCKPASKPAYASASASVTCALRTTAVENLYYDLFPNVATMTKVYDGLVASVAKTTMGSDCSNAWGLGECAYRSGGTVAGRFLRVVYRGADWLIWTTTKVRVLAELQAPGMDGPALQAYWATGAANPS
jgi:hypothetical protein